MIEIWKYLIDYVSYRAIESEWIWFSWIGIRKQLRPVTMLKKRLHLTCFLASSANFYITTAFETLANYFTNFWMSASRSFILELIETRFFLLQLSAFNGVAFKDKQLYRKETYEFWMQFHCVILFEAANKKALN